MSEALRTETLSGPPASMPARAQIDITWTLPPATAWDLMAVPVLFANAAALMRSDNPELAALMPFFVVFFVICLMLRFLMYGGVRPYSRLGVAQTVVLDGMQLALERQTRKGPEVRVFPILEMHDLRVLPLPQGQNPIVQHERLGFTHRGKAYSFAGLADDATAERVHAGIVDYDARLRVALGMDAEPNIGTLDRERMLSATAGGYDKE